MLSDREYSLAEDSISSLKAVAHFDSNDPQDTNVAHEVNCDNLVARIPVVKALWVQVHRRDLSSEILVHIDIPVDIPVGRDCSSLDTLINGLGTHRQNWKEVNLSLEARSKMCLRDLRPFECGFKPRLPVLSGGCMGFRNMTEEEMRSSLGILANAISLYLNTRN